MIMIARTAECRASGAATARAKEGVAREAVRVGTPRTMLAVRPMAAPRPRGLPRSRKARPTIRSRCEPRSRHILLRRPAIPWPYLGPRVRAALRAAGPSAATSATKRADLEAGRIHSTSLPPLDAPRPATHWTRTSRPQHIRRHIHTHTHACAPDFARRTCPAPRCQTPHSGKVTMCNSTRAPGRPSPTDQHSTPRPIAELGATMAVTDCSHHGVREGAQPRARSCPPATAPLTRRRTPPAPKAHATAATRPAHPRNPQ
jgi:hypothetical protein